MKLKYVCRLIWISLWFCLYGFIAFSIVASSFLSNLVWHFVHVVFAFKKLLSNTFCEPFRSKRIRWTICQQCRCIGMNTKWHLIGQTNATAHRILGGGRPKHNCTANAVAFFSLFPLFIVDQNGTIKSINTSQFVSIFFFSYNKITHNGKRQWINKAIYFAIHLSNLPLDFRKNLLIT